MKNFEDFFTLNEALSDDELDDVLFNAAKIDEIEAVQRTLQKLVIER
jgi:hypothetical protein